MKGADKPTQSPIYELQSDEQNYWLFKAIDDTAIHINDSTAMIWQLCTGEMTIAQIKKLLKDSYPEVGKEIPSDVDDALEMLEYHKAITSK